MLRVHVDGATRFEPPRGRPVLQKLSCGSLLGVGSSERQYGSTLETVWQIRVRCLIRRRFHVRLQRDIVPVSGELLRRPISPVIGQLKWAGSDISERLQLG